MNEQQAIQAARASAEAEDLAPRLIEICHGASWAGAMTALTIMLVFLFERSVRHRKTEPELREFMRFVTEVVVRDFNSRPRPN